MRSKLCAMMTLALLCGCPGKNEFVAPPPPKVTVATPDQEDVTDYAMFPGSVRGQLEVEVRARVKGFLESMDYTPGELVEKDTPLFQIDPSEYELAVAAAEADHLAATSEHRAAQADVVAAEAELALVDTGVQKLEAAYQSKAVSEIQVLEVKARREVSKAKVDQSKARLEVALKAVGIAKAKLARAQLDLDWATVKAPIKGRVSFWEVAVGTLVGAGDSTLLARMVDDERVFVDFDVSELWIQQVRRARKAEGKKPGGAIADLPIQCKLPSDDGFVHEGRGDYVAPSVDPITGTLRVRGVFENKARELLTGSYVQVRFPVGEREGALLIPRRAVSADQAGDYVLVVDESDTVERRDVELGADHGKRVVVAEGLDPDDRVIIVGIQSARPGAKVRPERARAESGAGSEEPAEAPKEPAKDAEKKG